MKLLSKRQWESSANYSLMESIEYLKRLSFESRFMLKIISVFNFNQITLHERQNI